MDSFIKIEIAGIVQKVRYEYTPLEGLTLIIGTTTKSGIKNNFAAYFTGEAYAHWRNKIYAGDYIHLLADIISANCDFNGASAMIRVRTPDMVICHESRFSQLK